MSQQNSSCSCCNEYSKCYYNGTRPTYNLQRIKSETLPHCFQAVTPQICSNLFGHVRKITQIAKERLKTFSKNREEIKDSNYDEDMPTQSERQTSSDNDSIDYIDDDDI